ncbi:MAG: DUF6236 family protein [Phycisphaerales bacterium]
MSQALFYPWIDIRDEAWLKTSLLYWDSVRTIVPESIDSPYSTDAGHALEQAGFLIPLRVHSGMDEIEELTGEVLAYLSTTEGAEVLVAEHGGHRHDIHVDKLPYQLGRLAQIHPEKLPHEIRHMLHGFAASSDRGSEWLRVDEGFANFYMTLLANRLADRVGVRLLTSLPAADRLAVTARLDAQLNGLIPWDMHGPWRRWREYEAFGPRRRMPRRLVPGMLANLAIERMGIAPDTPIDLLIDFRERHRDELALFRAKVDQLAASVEADLSTEALRQQIADLYANEVAPAISNLKAALRGRRIRWMSDGLLKIAFLSAGPLTMLVVAGLAVPIALLAGAGISLIATGTMYNVDKEESLRANPYAYLLSVERELT